MRPFSYASQMSRCALRGNCRTQPVVYFSILWSLITFLFLSSIPAYAEWVAVEKDYLLPGLETVYVDPESIRSSGVITECASQAILFCASLNPFQILNIMDLFN